MGVEEEKSRHFQLMLQPQRPQPVWSPFFFLYLLSRKANVKFFNSFWRENLNLFHELKTLATLLEVRTM